MSYVGISGIVCLAIFAACGSDPAPVPDDGGVEDSAMDGGAPDSDAAGPDAIGSDSATSDAADADAGAPNVGVRCGAELCDTCVLCGADPDDGSWTPECTEGPRSENCGRRPVAQVEVTCDGDEDCIAPERCMRVRAAMTRIECTAFDGCGLHRHVCDTDADCPLCAPTCAPDSADSPAGSLGLSLCQTD